MACGLFSLDLSFRKLAMEHIVKAYRLVLLDNDGTPLLINSFALINLLEVKSISKQYELFLDI